MKKQLYDYSGFSFKKLNDPRFSHIRLLAGWIIYFIFYFLTENLIPEERFHLIHCRLDDIIPFNEYFAVFYVGWYVLIAGSLAYTLFYDVENFKRIQSFIIVTQIVGTICYIVYPSVQDLRPETFQRSNIFTWILGLIYEFDTPTGVFPSLHVGFSLGVLSAALKDKGLKAVWKAALTAIVIMIAAAVCFVKQHSALDVLAAVPTGIIAELVVYYRDYWQPRVHERRRIRLTSSR